MLTGHYLNFVVDGDTRVFVVRLMDGTKIRFTLLLKFDE